MSKPIEEAVQASDTALINSHTGLEELPDGHYQCHACRRYFTSKDAILLQPSCDEFIKDELGALSDTATDTQAVERIKFAYKDGGYYCNQSGDMDGSYVRASDYDKLHDQFAHFLKVAGATIDSNGDLVFSSEGYSCWTQRKGDARTKEIAAENDRLKQQLSDLANLAINNEKLEREVMCQHINQQDATATLKELQNGLCKASRLAREALNLPPLREDKEPPVYEVEELKKKLEAEQERANGQAHALKTFADWCKEEEIEFDISQAEPKIVNHKASSLKAKLEAAEAEQDEAKDILHQWQKAQVCDKCAEATNETYLVLNQSFIATFRSRDAATR